MKKNRILKKILILTFIFQFIILVNTSQASMWSEIIDGGDNFLMTGQQQKANTVTSDADVQEIMDNIYSILFPLGVVITVAVGGVLGIKFMMASAEDKAKIKESMVPYVIGCFVIYGAFGIWKIAIEIFSALG